MPDPTSFPDGLLSTAWSVLIGVLASCLSVLAFAAVLHGPRAACRDLLIDIPRDWWRARRAWRAIAARWPAEAPDLVLHLDGRLDAVSAHRRLALEPARAALAEPLAALAAARRRTPQGADLRLRRIHDHLVLEEILPGGAILRDDLFRLRP